MKKIVFILFMICICLTGCGTKHLTCTATTSSSEELKLEEVLGLTFKGNEVTKMEIKSNIMIAGNYSKYVEDLETSLKENYIALEGKKGVTFKTNHTDSMITLDIKADLKKMNQEGKEALSIVNTKQSYGETKKELEEKGYQCK